MSTESTELEKLLASDTEVEIGDNKIRIKKIRMLQFEAAWQAAGAFGDDLYGLLDEDQFAVGEAVNRMFYKAPSAVRAIIQLATTCADYDALTVQEALQLFARTVSHNIDFFALGMVDKLADKRKAMLRADANAQDSTGPTIAPSSLLTDIDSATFDAIH